MSIYQSFCKDMEEIGQDKPSKPVMSDWIARVQGGLVARPGSTTDGADPVVLASLEEVLAEPIEEIVEEPAAINVEETPWSPAGKGEAEAEASIPRLFPNETLKLFADAPDQGAPMEDALAEARANLRNELKLTCLDGIDDLTDEVVSRAQKLARQMMVEILRELAAEMEAAA